MSLEEWLMINGEKTINHQPFFAASTINHYRLAISSGAPLSR